jgi:hypothetical protein
MHDVLPLFIQRYSFLHIECSSMREPKMMSIKYNQGLSPTMLSDDNVCIHEAIDAT